MSGSIDELIATLEGAAKGGVSLDQHTVLRALRLEQVREKVSALLARNFTMLSAAPAPSAIAEIVAVELVFLPPPGTANIALPKVIASFSAPTGEFISVSEPYSGTVASQHSSVLPFALAAPSFTEATALPDTDAALQAVQLRRTEYTGEVMGAEELSGVTAYPTTSQTGYPSASPTSYPTSGLTTPNDNDTRPDTRPDSTTDYRTDTTTDTKQDALMTELLLADPLSSQTSYNTASTTGEPTSYFTQYPTSGLTTPNDQDTRTDQRTDSRTDTRPDTTVDHRTDD